METAVYELVQTIDYTSVMCPVGDNILKERVLKSSVLIIEYGQITSVAPATRIVIALARVLVRGFLF